VKSALGSVLHESVASLRGRRLDVGLLHAVRDLCPVRDVQHPAETPISRRLRITRRPVCAVANRMTPSRSPARWQPSCKRRWLQLTPACGTTA